VKTFVYGSLFAFSICLVGMVAWSAAEDNGSGQLVLQPPEPINAEDQALVDNLELLENLDLFIEADIEMLRNLDMLLAD